MITVGRTANNDIVVADESVSRFHIYFQQVDGHWQVCDAGSRNGSRLDGGTLPPRNAHFIEPGATIQLGDVRGLFMTTEGLFDWLGNRVTRSGRPSAD
jgi:pSer/pThr/pTyr-binding forkhead associated (FHA) protein